MLARTRGELIVNEGCVALRSSHGDIHTLVFPPDYTLVLVDQKWQIKNSLGKGVGSVGDSIDLGGGESHVLPPGVASGCKGPFWRVTPKDVREQVPPGMDPPPIPD